MNADQTQPQFAALQTTPEVLSQPHHNSHPREAPHASVLQYSTYVLHSTSTTVTALQSTRASRFAGSHTALPLMLLKSATWRAVKACTQAPHASVLQYRQACCTALAAA
ncbi:hypothetical protein ABBQ38_007862 [Trebouxia sp. C0009 RCD-2024]